MDFGKAIDELKVGNYVARAGWNGKGMFLFIQAGSFDREATCFGGKEPSFIEGIARELFDYGDTGTVTRLPNINMRSATGAIVTGWLASQTDMLAEDWLVIEREDARMLGVVA